MLSLVRGSLPLVAALAEALDSLSWLQKPAESVVSCPRSLI